MLRDKGFYLFLLLVLVLLLVPFVHGDDDEPASHVRIVRLSYVEGQVQIAHHQGFGFENATMNMPLVQGDQLRTGNDGWVEVQLENSSIIRLAPDSQITFAVLTRFPSGATATEVNLDAGEGEFAAAAGNDDGPFRVNVRQHTISLKRTSRFRVTTVNNDPLEVTVWKGEVSLSNPDDAQELSIRKNEVFMLDPQDFGHYDLENNAQADDLDKWSGERDQYLSTYASNSNMYTQSPYQYGVSDLSYYGQYSNVVGCGYCWQPYGVSADWDPYMNGYWMNSPWGFTWVSGYPWGWMPYRFGQWVFVPGFGWRWRPGAWNRWAAFPRVVNAPAGFKPPFPPAVGAKATVPLHDGGATKFNGGSANLTVDNQHGRQVISNENIVTASPAKTEVPNGVKTGPDAQVERFHSPHAGNNSSSVPGNAAGVAAVPPVTPRRVPPPVVHVSPSPAVPVARTPQAVSHPQSYSPQAPVRSYSPPPVQQRSYSPPPQRSYSPPPAAASHGTSTSSGRPR